MKKIAILVAVAGLSALAACNEEPTNETNNAAAVNVVEANAMENAVNAAAENTTAAVNATANAANAAH